MEDSKSEVQSSLKRSSEESNGAEESSKKSRLEENAVSKVIHIRSIPSDCSETDVVQLGLPFGRMNNILVLKQKNQAFLEMESESVAEAMVNYYNDCQAVVRGRRVYLQYSKHKELKTDQTHAHTNAAAQAALHAAQTLVGAEEAGGAGTILRVIVDNMLYPVTIDALHQIFSKFGSVLRIVTFMKNDTFQALVQFSEVNAAQTAREQLDGLNVYNGCCTLRIDFSKLTTLSVRYNSEKSRDFTNPSLPTGPGGGRDEPGRAGVLGASRDFSGSRPMGMMGGSSGGLGGMMAGMGPRGDSMGAHSRGGGGGMGPGGMPPTGPSPVVLVSNLNEDMVTPDRLFTLLGVYGDVVRVKILFNKKDNALVQFSDPMMAQWAIQHLNHASLWDKSLRLSASKHMQVQLPRDGQDEAKLTRDYTNSPLHRFKKPGSKNFQNIFPPAAVLHLSNIPATVSEEELKEAFGEFGTVTSFRFFQKDRKMALIEMASVTEATEALIGMHDRQFVPGQNLRVSFSKPKM